MITLCPRQIWNSSDMFTQNMSDDCCSLPQMVCENFQIIHNSTKHWLIASKCDRLLRHWAQRLWTSEINFRSNPRWRMTPKYSTYKLSEISAINCKIFDINCNNSIINNNNSSTDCSTLLKFGMRVRYGSTEVAYGMKSMQFKMWVGSRFSSLISLHLSRFI